MLPQDLSIEFIHPLEFARQMALVDHKLYRSIRPSEFLHLNWTRKDKATLAPNILKMISQFNRVGEWVIYTISHAKKEKHCVKLLSQLIEIAYESYKLANFNGAMAMMSGLKHNTVVRKKDIWVRIDICDGIILLIPSGNAAFQCLGQMGRNQRSVKAR